MQVNYVFEDGKYLVQRNPDTWEIKVYRNGEFWETATNEYRHNKMFHAMLNKVDQLEESLSL